RASGARLRAAAANGSTLDLAGSIVLVERTPARLDVSRLIDGEIVPLATIDEGGAFALAGVGHRIVVVWRDADADAFQIAEVSLSTGTTFFEGEAARPAVVSLQDFQFLVVVLMSVMFGVLLFVLRGDEDGGVITLPEGTCLAGLGRRTIAWWIDEALLCWAVASMSGTSFESLFTLSALRTEVGMLLLLGVLVLGFLVGTILEASFGRTPGKLVCGCSVVRTSDGGRPRFQQAFIRNLTKWLMPAILLQALVDPNRRHRADILARTVVVMPLKSGMDSDPE
ncbi:MAG: RDD family protein, partial [Phycisphaerales bacterium]|nr:RDD family protein [Phycisphaerales bacterium]